MASTTYRNFKVFGRSQLPLATGTCTPLSIANRRQGDGSYRSFYGKVTMVRYLRESVISVLFLSLLAAIFLFMGISDNEAVAWEHKTNPHELKEQFDGRECANCHRQTPARMPENHTRAVLPGPG